MGRALESVAGHACLNHPLSSPRLLSPRASHQAEGLHTRPCSVERQTGKAWATCGPDSEWIQDTGSHLGDMWPLGEWQLTWAGPKERITGGEGSLQRVVGHQEGHGLGALGTIPQPGSRRGGGVSPMKSFNNTVLHFFIKPKTTSSSNREARDLSEDGTGPPPQKEGTWRKR